MSGHWAVGLAFGVATFAAVLLLLWPRMAPFVPRQQEARLAMLDEHRSDVEATLSAAEKAVERARVIRIPVATSRIHTPCFDHWVDGYHGLMCQPCHTRLSVREDAT